MTRCVEIVPVICDVFVIARCSILGDFLIDREMERLSDTFRFFALAAR